MYVCMNLDSNHSQRYFEQIANHVDLEVHPNNISIDATRPMLEISFREKYVFKMGCFPFHYKTTVPDIPMVKFRKGILLQNPNITTLLYSCIFRNA